MSGRGVVNNFSDRKQEAEGKVRAGREMSGDRAEREERQLSVEAGEHMYLAQRLETNEMQFNKVLCLERGKISV